MSNEQNTQAGANFLTNDQIAAGAAIECDHGAPIGRNVAIDVFDAMRAAAPVAAQAGHVAVPQGWSVERVGDAIHIKRADGKWCGIMPSIGPAAALTFEFLSAMLAAAPSAPAVAQQAPVSQPLIGKLLDQFSELPVLWGLNEPGALVRHGDVFKMLVDAGKAERTQASTPAERQEGGAA